MEIRESYTFQESATYLSRLKSRYHYQYQLIVYSIGIININTISLNIDNIG